MHWKFDIDRRSLVRASDELSVKSAKLAFPDKYPLKIDFFRGPDPFVFSGRLVATVKPSNQQTRSALAVMTTPVESAASVEGILDLATAPLKMFVKDFGERPVALELLVLNSEGAEIASWTVNCEVSRRYTDSEYSVAPLPSLKATLTEAETGLDNTKWMTPLRVWDALRKWAALSGIEILEDP